MDVVNKIKIYEVDGEPATIDDRFLVISSDINNKMINIHLENEGSVPSKQSSFFTISAEELRKAIDNATNK